MTLLICHLTLIRMNTKQEQMPSAGSFGGGSRETGPNYKQEANTAIHRIKDMLSKSVNVESRQINLDDKILMDLGKIGDLIQEHRIVDNKREINRIIFEAKKYLHEKDLDLGNQTLEEFGKLEDAVRMIDWKKSESETE